MKYYDGRLPDTGDILVAGRIGECKIVSFNRAEGEIKSVFVRNVMTHEDFELDSLDECDLVERSLIKNKQTK